MIERNVNTAELFRNSGRFEYIYEVRDFVFVASHVCDLTAFFSPKIETRFGYYSISCELGITTTVGSKDQEDRFRSNLLSGKYVILPRTLPSNRPSETIDQSGKISQWLVEDMIHLIQTYCLSSKDAISLILDSDDRFIQSLKMVYQDEFDEIIVNPLLRRGREVDIL